MSSQSNPFKLHSVTPYLIVEDAMAVVRFAQSIVNAKLDRGEPHKDENGRVVHVELTIGDSVVMIGESNSEFQSSQATLYTYVDDCDSAYQNAIDQGFESVLEPTNFPHGDRYGGIKDPCGNTWWLVTHQKSPVSG